MQMKNIHLNKIENPPSVTASRKLMMARMSKGRRVRFLRRNMANLRGVLDYEINLNAEINILVQWGY
ncbi:hypothetical protein [Vandammella animalimorsus]|uniref:hypothetical protein n=1 Tax=Vandammella animalimorsus TaxID=2029117 RepID=UPI0011778858|nr:hypothetical protein [Vandammella animalimorsus]